MGWGNPHLADVPRDIPRLKQLDSLIDWSEDRAMAAVEPPKKTPVRDWRVSRKEHLDVVVREVRGLHRIDSEVSARRCFICGAAGLCDHREEGLRELFK